MQIESIIKREAGHSVDLDGQLYSFLPNSNPPYVTEVEDPDHIGLLLSIREGYRVFGAGAEKTETSAVRDKLVAEYEAKFGKKPHYKLSVEKIQAAIDGGSEE